MTDKPKLVYFGWSCFSVETSQGVLLFDPFFRPECGAEWAHLEDFTRTNIICLTHGHHEHYLDTSVVAKKTGAAVVAPSEICNHLKSKYGINPSQLKPINPGQTVELYGFRITAFEWRHRTINLWKAFFGGGILHGLNFVYNGMIRSPFWTRKFGYHLEMPDGTTITNYCEGLNDNMVMEEVRELGRRFQTEILLTGFQLSFEKYVGLGVAALAPKKVVLFHPHEKLFAKIGVPTSPLDSFIGKIKQSTPGAEIIMTRPGTQVVYRFGVTLEVDVATSTRRWLFHALIIIDGLIKARAFEWHLKSVCALWGLPHVQRIWLFNSLPIKRALALEYSAL